MVSSGCVCSSTEKIPNGRATRRTNLSGDGMTGKHSRGNLAPRALVCACLILTTQTSGASRSIQNANADRWAPIMKGIKPAEIVATVVAMSRDRMEEIPYYSADILLLKVDKVFDGKAPGPYVRADFLTGSNYTRTDQVGSFSRLEHSLRMAKTWKIRLRPPTGSAECAWKLPPPARPEEELTLVRPPVILPIGGALKYPEINTLPCYVFDQKDIQEVVPPEKGK